VANALDTKCFPSAVLVEWRVLLYVLVVLDDMPVECCVPFLLGFTHHLHNSFMRAALAGVEGVVMLALLSIRTPLRFGGGDGEPEGEEDKDLLSDKGLSRLGEGAGP